ncbi:MAG: hypothetical protein KBD19_03545 [Candidatus Moranbacteria bacterium]|nr:hypothetical protein [Candidatus Moranbacteria bacterium]
MAKKIPKKKDDEKSFSSGEVMSLLEAMNEGIQIIAEDQSDIKQRMLSLESKIDRLQEDMTDVKYMLSEKVDRAEFKKLEKRMVKVEKLVFSASR